MRPSLRIGAQHSIPGSSLEVRFSAPTAIFHDTVDEMSSVYCDDMTYRASGRTLFKAAPQYTVIHTSRSPKFRERVDLDTDVARRALPAYDPGFRADRCSTRRQADHVYHSRIMT